ncbi:DUF1449 domain-containing protein [Neorhodopirellula lusitana]|uniref:DUF1449 domain-containing protein n=1 Tax=Neorhodopirellula lusitana TaxID=445327 RepID=UPI00384FE1A1
MSLIYLAQTHWSDRFIEHLFVGPMWPATMLALFVWAFVLISLLGFFSIDLGVDSPEIDLDPGLDLAPDIDLDPTIDVDGNLDVDTSVDASGHDAHADMFGGLAAATLKAVHLDRVPLMIWLATFSLLFWVISYLLWFEFDVERYSPIWLHSIALTIRNAVIAVVCTRFLTMPLHRLLVPPVQYHTETLVGDCATVETSEVNEQFGRARYATNAAPLLIDIRTTGEVIPKGSNVRILRYNAQTKTYLVQSENENDDLSVGK